MVPTSITIPIQCTYTQLIDQGLSTDRIKNRFCRRVPSVVNVERDGTVEMPLKCVKRREKEKKGGAKHSRLIFRLQNTKAKVSYKKKTMPVCLHHTLHSLIKKHLVLFSHSKMEM